MNMILFEEAHAAFIQDHLRRRTGERKDRLVRGHREAEKLFCSNVWWPLKGNFDGLHPEFEVVDWRGIPYYCDFAWLSRAIKLIIEIKGFGPHVRDMDRRKYCYELNRETFLTAMGYIVISFSYDDVVERPDLCISLLRMVLNRFYPETSPVDLSKVSEREVVRLAYMLARPVRPVDVASHLCVNHRTAVRTLQALVSKGVFFPVSGPGGLHITKYELRGNQLHWL